MRAQQGQIHFMTAASRAGVTVASRDTSGERTMTPTAMSRPGSRRVPAPLLANVSAVVIPAACGSGDETIEQRWGRLGVADPEFVFLGDFTDEERAAITRWVKRAVGPPLVRRIGLPQL